MKNEIVHSASTTTNADRSNTPLTDTIWDQTNPEKMYSFARRLERDRAELIEALRILVDACSEKTEYGTLRIHPNVGAFEIAIQALAKVKP